MRIKPLPPLKSLVTFESAARHLNFTQAADELCVTQGAVSKQIRLLENYVGQELFIRGKRNLVLTSAGRRYHQSIRKSLASMAVATADVMQAASSEHITIATISGIASLWLMPRFAEFEDQNPGVDVRITVVESIDDVAKDNFDVGVFYSDHKPVGFDSKKLFSERIFPVCSPAFLDKHPEIKTANNLGKSKLLIHDTDEPWINWHEWLISSGLDPVAKEATQTEINDYPLLIQACLGGQGVALAWEKLVDDHLNTGRLIAPILNTLETHSHFYAITPNNLTLKPQARAFIDHLASH